MSKTGRFYITTKDGRKFCVEPIDNSLGKSKQKWGDIDPATKKLTGNYDGKDIGAIHEDDSIITEENGFKNIITLPAGTSPIGYIDSLIKKNSISINVNGRDVISSKYRLSYKDVVQLAEKKYNEYYTITYSNKDKKEILNLNSFVWIKEGMIFNVHMTGNA